MILLSLWLNEKNICIRTSRLRNEHGITWSEVLKLYYHLQKPTALSLVLLMKRKHFEPVEFRIGLILLCLFKSISVRR
jgi:hypothetical protein